MRGAAGMVVAHGHTFAMRRMPGDGGVDFAGIARKFAAHNRVVNFPDLARGKLFGKCQMRLVILGNDEAAAGFLVQPVNDARPRDTADAAERTPAMVEQRVDECVFLVSGGRMYDEPGGLVQNQQRFVLEKYVERNFLRLRLSGPGFRPVNFDLLAGARAVRGFDRVAVDADVALFDQSFECDARNGGKFFTQKSVQPPIGK